MRPHVFKHKMLSFGYMVFFRCTLLVELVDEGLDFLHHSTQWEYVTTETICFYQTFLPSSSDTKIKSNDEIPDADWMKDVWEQRLCQCEKHKGERENNTEGENFCVLTSIFNET